MNFKEGDIVRVKQNLVCGRRYGVECFVSEMLPFSGVSFEISKVIKTRNWYILKDSIYNWTDEMLEPVKKERPMKFEIAYHGGLYGLRCKGQGIGIVGYYSSLSDAKRGLNRFLKKIQDGNFTIEVKK